MSRGSGLGFTEPALIVAFEKARRDEYTLAGILHATRESIWMFGLDGAIEMANPTALKRVGRTFAEIQGKIFYDLIPPDVAAIRRAKIAQVIETKSEVEFEDERDGYTFLHSFLPVFNDLGDVRSIVSFSRDITERKHAEEAVRYQSHLTRTITENAGSCLFMMDERGFVTYMNPAAERVTGYKLEELRDKPLHYYVHHHRPNGDFYPMEECPLGAAYFQFKTLHEQEENFIRKDGSFFPVRFSIGPVMVGGAMVGAVLEFRDITEQKRTELALKEAMQNALEASAAKSQFLANISHELRTPIGIIMGFSDLMRNPANSDVERENYMRVIEKNSQQLLRLIDDILDLSKVEAGKMAVENREFSLSEFLTDFGSAMGLKASEKGIAFHMKRDTEIPNVICTDHVRLRQVLANVVGNAIKFTSRGSVELSISAEEKQIQFVVTDTGPGITSAQSARLFQPFEQADPSMSRHYGGTGLGLVLAKRLSQALGGDLVLDWSEPGKGSRFIATIRALSSVELQKPKSAVTRVSDDSTAAPTPLGGLNVLLVEDSADNQVLVSTYLKKAGANVSIANDGREGIDKAISNQPDIVLMDIQMPNVDGHSATRELRKMGFNKPIIALTAHAMREERDRCIASGFTDYLTKPLSRDRLVDTLTQYRN